jgi:PAS domain S-box-containing protein
MVPARMDEQTVSVSSLNARIEELERENQTLQLELDRARDREGRENEATNERLALIFDSATEYAIFTLDPEGRVTSWNRGAQRLLGYSDDEIIGRDGRVLFTAEDQQRGAADWEIEQALSEGRAGNERWHVRKDGSRFWGSGVAMALRSGSDPGVLKIMRDDTRRRHAEEQRRLLIGELNHRVKNTLASVQAIVAQTLRSAPSMESFAELLRSRIFALARAHDLLTRETWSGATMADVAHSALEPWREGKQIEIKGPNVRLKPSQALSLSMALHELAINAAKHGALSTPEGRVVLEWDNAGELLITWSERDGPPVSPPQREGFGSRVLNRALAIELSGDVSVSYEPQGVVCTIRVPDAGV